MSIPPITDHQSLENTQCKCMATARVEMVPMTRRGHDRDMDEATSIIGEGVVVGAGVVVVSDSSANGNHGLAFASIRLVFGTTCATRRVYQRRMEGRARDKEVE